MRNRRGFIVAPTGLALGLLGVAMLRAESSRVQSATPAAPSAKHGLRGEYFTAKGFRLDSHNVPLSVGPPATVRVDDRIAFGRGQGFVWDVNWKQRGDGGSIWWLPPQAGAVIWKGFIHLPKAGTYYIVTASRGASAVYVNGARVGLNGSFGGSIPTPAFVYDDPAVPKPYKAVSDQYAFPVVISTARVLPVEVRYSLHDSSSYPRGIDLYWVTPDSVRDAKGAPVATIVPSEALYVDSPEPVYQSAVSGAHTTMSSDLLYLPSDTDEPATLTIRVADKNGHPLAGRHVQIAALQSAEHGAHTITQPTAPTDAHGVTTARFRANGALTYQLFATVIDEPAAVGQVVEIVGQRAGLSFLPLTYSPYYAGALFKVEPLPMRVGQPVHLRVPLKNYKKEAYALHVRASANPPNIGMLKWTDVGRTETFVLQPGESREVTITWTPTVAAGKLCLKVEVWGNAARAEAAAPFSVFRAAFVQQPVPGPASPFPGLSGIPLDIRQHNFFDGVTCSIPERKPEAAPSPEGNPVPTTSSGSIVVVEGRVEIRQSPNASAPLVGKAMDRSLTYTQVVRQDGEVTWYYVTPPSASRSGWISAKDVVKDNPDGPPKKPTDSPRLGGPATKGDCGGCVPPSGQELALLENEWDRRQAEAKPLKGDLEQLLKVFQEMQSLLLGYREAIALCALYDISKEILSAASGNLGEIADILEKLIDGDLTLLTKLLGSDEVSTLVDLYGGAFPEGFDWSGNARAKIESCTILPDGDRARALSFLDKREEVRQRMRALQEKVNNVRSRDHELIGKWLKYLDACHAWAACAKLPASSCAQPPAGLNVPGR